jgi:3-oxoadipate enol-lactonase
MTMPFLELRGCDLYYETHGEGPPLVFAHGAGGNHLSWWQQVAHFRDRYTCVTFAHRGFGLSRATPEGPNPDAYIDDLSALIEHLGFGEVRLVAQSMGGWTCLGYALREPARVRALVMAATVGSLAHSETERLRATHGATNPRAALQARGIHPACGERMAQEQPAMHFLYTQVAALNTQVDSTSLIARLMAARTTPADAVAALQVPTLCIAGEEDAVLPAAAVEILAGLLPNARFVGVPRAGHTVYWEPPDTFNHLVDEHLVGSSAEPIRT